jgi:phosphatidate cytidylyltransferase
MLKYRLISFPLLLALLYLIVFVPPAGNWLFAAATGFLIVMALYEAGTLVEKLGLPCYPRLIASFGILALIYFTPHHDRYLYIFLAALALAGVASFWLTVLQSDIEMVRKLLVSFGVVIVVGVPLAAVGAVYLDFSPMALFFLIATTKAMDTGGYVFGMLSNKLMPGGNHKIAPSISPRKSYEGFFGGLIFSMLVGYLFCCFSDEFVRTPVWIIFAGVLALGSFFGDLTESALKRAAGVKDSGAWLPGMGGALDLVDSFIYNGIIFYLLLQIFK